jgi:NAD(P)-dependent dehydrogenase (short-subunit alcohol dehydrogenase family)
VTGVFDGLAALIPGGGSGIGLASARALAKEGAVVVLAGRNGIKVKDAAAALEEETGVDARGVVCDVASEGAVAEAAAAADSLAPEGLRLCVAAAGLGTFAPIAATPLEAWDAVLATNLTGAFLTIKHVAGYMAARGGGAIAAISSIAGPLTHRYMAAYCVSKAGVDALVRNAADELGVSGIRVNGIQPSLVPTELASALEGDPGVRADYLAQMPGARLGTVEDCAAAVRYLVGPESGWVTGQLLPVDGGHTLRRGPDLTPWAAMAFPGQPGVPAVAPNLT